jgi:hypothetical protein
MYSTLNCLLPSPLREREGRVGDRRVEIIDQITKKKPNLNVVFTGIFLIEFKLETVSQVGIFDPSYKLAPL